MFSFRTTPLDEQPDLVLRKGRIGVLCNQVAWNPEKGEYLFETLYRNGNLKKVFLAEGSEDLHLPELDGVEFLRWSAEDEDSLSAQTEELENLDALIVELQDVGARYNPVPATLYDLFQILHYNDFNLSVYILDRENPTGRVVEGTMLLPEYASLYGVEGLPHRHGLTIGELANMFHSEIGAKFPLHVISYIVRSATKYMMPWSIPPTPDITGFFSCTFFSGQSLWEGTNVSVGKGTPRPFEIFGAPFMESLADYNSKHGLPNWNHPNNPIYDPGVFIRWLRFVPLLDKYASESCFGFQLLPNPGVQYHTLGHALRIIRFVSENCPNFAFLDDCSFYFGDSMLLDYVRNGGDWGAVKEHIKIEEQKWIRKVKKYLLYDDQLWRIKSFI